jgi:hypothetical protein
VWKTSKKLVERCHFFWPPRGCEITSWMCDRIQSEDEKKKKKKNSFLFSFFVLTVKDAISRERNLGHQGIVFVVCVGQANKAKRSWRLGFVQILFAADPNIHHTPNRGRTVFSKSFVLPLLSTNHVFVFHSAGAATQTPSNKQQTTKQNKKTCTLRKANDHSTHALHTMVNNIPCKYYAKGQCLKGADCNYLHAQPQQQQQARPADELTPQKLK